MPAPPLVSVVITTYNRAGILADAVQSVCDQSGPPWELVLVDDGSTDNTADVVAAWRDPRIRCLPQPNRGLAVGGHCEVDSQLRPLRNVRTWELSPSLSLRDFVLGCPFVPSTVMVRREWLHRVGGFDASIFGADDWDCWLRLALAGCRMSWVPRIVTGYRVHGANMQSSSVIKMQAGMAAVLDKLFARPGLPDEILALRAEAYGKM